MTNCCLGGILGSRDIIVHCSEGLSSIKLVMLSLQYRLSNKQEHESGHLYFLNSHNPSSSRRGQSGIISQILAMETHKVEFLHLNNPGHEDR